MRYVLLFTFSFLSILVRAQLNSSSIHSFDAVTITGDTISLSQYAGKKLMIVNTASYCGYTPQFADLQQLYALYHLSNDFEIIGFPCNDFNGQDPLTDSGSYAFCTSNYNVTFQMMSHVNINVGSISPIYQWLKSQALNGVSNAIVTWNFNKFLIDEAGHWIAHYTETTNPMAQSIVDWITSPNVYTSLSNSDFAHSKFAYSYSTNLITLSNLHAKSRIELYNLEGKCISQTHTNSSTFELCLSHLAKGLYVIKVYDGTSIDFAKISIQ